MIAVASFVELLRVGWNVHVMPRPGRSLLASDGVRPACNFGVGDIDVGAEQFVNLGLGFWRETFLGDERDDLPPQAKNIEGISSTHAAIAASGFTRED